MSSEEQVEGNAPTPPVQGSCAVLNGFEGELKDRFVIDTRDYARGPDEVLIKVLACAVNPSDVKLSQGMFPSCTLPVVTGRDYSGVVVAGPEEWVGKEVYGTGTSLGQHRAGSHAQYLVLPADQVVLKPKNLSHEEAGTVGVPYLTAFVSLVDKANLQKDDILVVQGASGMVASAAMHLAKSLGATVIALVRHTSPVVPQGADHAICTTGKDEEAIRAEICKLCPDRDGCDVFLDCFGGESTNLGIKSLGSHGRLVVMSTPDKDNTASFNILNLYRKELSIHGVNTYNPSLLPETTAAAVMRTLAEMFESGQVFPLKVNPTRYALSEISLAFAAVSKRCYSRVALLPWGAGPHN